MISAPEDRAAMADFDGSMDGVAGDAEADRPRASKLLARTRAATKQAVVFDEDEDGGGGLAATAVIPAPSLAKTWSPGSRVGNDGHLAASSHMTSPAPPSGDEAEPPARDPAEEQAAERLRAERIARRAAKLREIEERDGNQLANTHTGGFGRTFGGEYSDDPAAKAAEARAREPKPAAAHPEPFAVSKLDHREVFGHRTSVVDGLLDMGTGNRSRKPGKGAGAPAPSQGGELDGLRLEADAATLLRGGADLPPEAHKANRVVRQAGAHREQSRSRQAAKRRRVASAAQSA